MTRNIPVLSVCLLVIWMLSLFGQQVAAQDDVQKVADRIDDLIAHKWSENGVVSASPADDAEYLRRVWLDIGGKIPPPRIRRTFWTTRRLTNGSSSSMNFSTDRTMS